MQEILSRLDQVQLTDSKTVQNLTMFPLLCTREEEPGYLTLDEALQQQVVTVDEVSESGSVPELKLVNAGTLPVLLVDGEELVGAKQNRVLNLTILVAAMATTMIPVSCVEAGRWSRRSDTFGSAAHAQYAEGRAMKMEHVTRSLKQRGDRFSDQSEVWADIRAKSDRLGATSETGAMADIYKQRGASIDEYVRALPPVSDQVGAAFAIDGRLVGFDLFDSAHTLKMLLPKLVRSFALDAVDRLEPRANSETSIKDVKAFLAEVAEAPADRFPATGLGEDLRFNSDRLSGAALLVGHRVVHLSGFRKVASAGEDAGRT